MVEFGNNLEGNNNLDGNNLDKSKNNRIQRGLLNRDPAQGTVKKPPFSFLDLKIKIATRMFQHCNFCEKACGVDRRFEKGECGVDGSHISSEFLHVGEEPPLVPSHTIFFSGCNFNCVYCQNWDISQNPDRGIRLSEKDLALIIENRRRQGSRNVNFVGGDPTPNLHYILGTMQLVRDNIPLVWNSNLYLSTEAMQLLDGFVDLYLTDFKYGNDECAQRLSNIPSYMEVVGRNHRMAFHAGDIIIRHLVLPNHVECCSKPLLEWISKNLGLKPVLNIMGQYHPVYKAQDHVEISGLPSSSEISEVIHYAHDLGFNNLV
ncbi:MAG: radical SAM protein [Methanobacteriaceae archaeon]|nr:radical SAM protein [Methanobacteriaceae archaeon]